jgi:hypothetical protein
MKKSADKIKFQLQFWLLKYYVKKINDLTGKEIFTLFDLLDDGLKNQLVRKMNLRDNEIPALSLRISNDSFIINTTERFIRLSGNTLESVDYRNFQGHSGFGEYIIKKRIIRKSINVKDDGYLSDFVIEKKNGDKLLWKIPTGTPGFGFWNVTKKCELIGRKYLS